VCVVCVRVCVRVCGIQGSAELKNSICQITGFHEYLRKRKYTAAYHILIRLVKSWTTYD